VHDPGPPYDGHPSSSLTATADEITCQQFVELVTDYFEGALGPRTRGQVEEHLVMCDWCVTYADQMESTVLALHELKDREAADPSDALLTALRARDGS
jgi:predicted anti-sigma-YlaC factor YlaD